jgi:hypothetical protein
MSTTTLDQLGPVLASELPPVTPQLTLVQRIRTALQVRVWERRFERALRHASHSEAGDLLAAARRS